MEAKTSQNMIVWFFLACFLVSMYFMGWVLSPFFAIIVLAAVVTGVFYPVYRFFHAKDKINATFASLITCLLIFLILFIPLVFFFGILTQEALGLYQMAKSAVLNDEINTLIKNSQYIEKANIILSKFKCTFPLWICIIPDCYG